MIEPKVIRFKGCRVEYWRLGHFIRTVFPDGLTVPAVGNHDQESVDRAAALGYQSTWEMSRDHECLHTLIAEAQGHEYSRVLRGVAVRAAGGRKEDIISADDSWREECLVLSAQKYIQLGIVDEVLAASGLDLDALAAALRSMTSD